MALSSEALATMRSGRLQPIVSTQSSTRSSPYITGTFLAVPNLTITFHVAWKT